MNTKYGRLFFISVLFFTINCFAQDAQTDSLLTLLRSEKKDTVKINLLNALSKNYLNISPENALTYALQAKQLAEKKGYKYGLAYALKNIGISYYMQSDYIKTLTYWNQSLKEFETLNDEAGIANILSNLGAVYSNQGDDAMALDYYFKSLKHAEQIGDSLRIVTLLNNIGAVYFHKVATYDQALNYYLKALPICERVADKEVTGTIMVNIGEIYLEKGDDKSALKYFEQSIKVYGDSKSIPYSLNDVGKVYEKRGNYVSALNYHKQALDIATKISAKLDVAQSLIGMAAIYLKTQQLQAAFDAYKKSEVVAKEIGANYELKNAYEGLALTYSKKADYVNAFKYQSLLTTIKDTLYNTETDKRLGYLQFNFELQKQQEKINSLTSDKTLRELDLKRQGIVRNSLIVVLLLVTVIVFVLFRNYRIKAKANTLLDHRQKELEQTLSELKTMQTQLIQSEKMASLGELTAGIAHEIQNPLNFVNNFAEVNKELLTEMKDELDNGNINEAKAVADNVMNNEEKISFHGNRADAIVKGMLQHSRKSTGQKELTDINTLADEYLRLSYHGLRAKDKSFNTQIKTDFDKTIGQVNIVAQNLGRVILNLLNNAFYAVNEKKKSTHEDYEPTVMLQTKKLKDKIEIRIKDNGNGIPQNITDKIFQPFFTTKPSGAGTGLGLSLTYDIITKEHNGSINVNSKEGEGTEFIIQIPAV